MKSINLMIGRFKSINQLKAGAILSYINIILSIGVGVFLTPFIIKSLGDSEYGLYTLIGSFVAYLSLMDLGLNYTVVRFVAKYRAEKDIEGERNFLNTAMFIYIIISVVLVFIGMYFYFNLDGIFSKSLTKEQLVDAKIMYLILVFNLAITLPGNTFSAICNAYERFIFPRTMSILRYVLRLVVVYVVIKLGGKAIALVVIDTMFNIFIIVTSLYYARIELNVKVKAKRASLNEMRHIFSFSSWIFISTIVFTFQWQAGQIVLGINLNTVVVAIYAVGIMLGSYYTTFASAINSLIIPKATQMVVANHNGMQLTDMIIKVGRLNNYIMLLVIGGFFLFGNEFISLWIGDNYKDSWTVALLIMLVYNIPMTQSFATAIIEAKNKIAFRAIWDITSMLIAVIIGFFISKYYGIIGMISCLVVAKAINVIVINVYYKYVFEFRILHFFKKTYIRQLLILGGFTYMYYLAIKSIDIGSWEMLIFNIVVYVILFVLLSYIFVFTKQEKEMIKRSIGRD